MSAIKKSVKRKRGPAPKRRRRLSSSSSENYEIEENSCSCSESSENVIEVISPKEGVLGEDYNNMTVEDLERSIVNIDSDEAIEETQRIESTTVNKELSEHHRRINPKYRPNGMANRLKALVKRHNSDMFFWNKYAATNPGNVFTVSRVRKMYALHLFEFIKQDGSPFGILLNTDNNKEYQRIKEGTTLEIYSKNNNYRNVQIEDITLKLLMNPYVKIISQMSSSKQEHSFSENSPG